MISNFCLLLLLSVVASRQVEQPFARVDNVAWFFQTQIDQNKDGFAEFDEFVATLKVIHPDVLLSLQQPDAGEHHINSEYKPIREFIKSRDSNSVSCFFCFFFVVKFSQISFSFSFCFVFFFFKNNKILYRMGN